MERWFEDLAYILTDNINGKNIKKMECPKLELYSFLS